MPSLLTHKIFTKEIFENLNKKDLIDPAALSAFSQSHDCLYFYQGIKGKEIHSLGKLAHKNNSQDFIYNVLSYIKENNLENNKQIISFLYGILSHYVLDSTMHPYIYYKTGLYKKNNKDSKKYLGLHNKLEKYIDIYYYEKHFNKDIKKLNIKNEILVDFKLEKETAQLIDYAYNKTYNYNNVSKYYFKGFKYTRILKSIISQDTKGYKKKILGFFSKLFFKNYDFLANYSYYKNDDYKIIISDNNKWFHPCTNEEHTTTFDKLYEESKIIFLDIIKQVDEILYNDKDIESIKEYIPNISYLTGIDCNSKLKLQYFEK